MENQHKKFCINVEEMGKRMGVSRCRAYELVKVEGFPRVQFGKRILVPVDALQRWLEEQARDGRAI
jgi:DNA binding domain, excisionase family